MKTKFWSSILTFLLLIQPVFLFAQNTQSTSDTDICAAPGETMLLYQRFQQEMASALLGGVLGEHIFHAEFSVMGLFTSKVLHLPTTNNSVLDTIRQTLWNNSRRLGTATVTTTVLLALAGVSVGVSNIEGFAILFQNRAIVRDYKSLLQIETKLNQIAYFLGKRTNLIAKLDNTGDGGALQKIVEKYVEEGLFTGNVRNDQTTYVGILTSLMRMNAGVKQFLSFRSTLLLNKLGNFYGTTFSETALSNLRSEYAGARFIDSCNTMGKRAFARIGNAGKAVGSSFKQAETTILKAAAIRFSNAFLEGSSRAEIVKRPGVAEKYFDDDELQQLRTIYGVDTSKMTETTAKGRRRIITPTTSTKKVLKDIGEKTVSLVESSIKAGTNAIASTKEYIDYLKENYKQHGWVSSLEWRTQRKSKDEATFSSLNLSESDKQTIAYTLNETLNRNFNDSLQLAFATSQEKAQQLFSATTQDFLIADNSDQTFQFNAIISQLKEIEALIGKTNENGLLKLVGDICEFQCGNKGNKGCRPK